MSDIKLPKGKQKLKLILSIRRYISYNRSSDRKINGKTEKDMEERNRYGIYIDRERRDWRVIERHRNVGRLIFNICERFFDSRKRIT